MESLNAAFFCLRHAHHIQTIDDSVCHVLYRINPEAHYAAAMI
jgi:hypothetical protein